MNFVDAILYLIFRGFARIFVEPIEIEPHYRRGRKNEQDAVGFLNRNDRRFVIFNRHSKKYMTRWVMKDLQYQEFRNNNNIIPINHGRKLFQTFRLSTKIRKNW